MSNKRKWVVYFLNTEGYREGIEHIFANNRGDAIRIYKHFFNVQNDGDAVCAFTKCTELAPRDQQLMVAIIWVKRNSVQLFHYFPEVFWIDHIFWAQAFAPIIVLCTHRLFSTKLHVPSSVDG